MADRIREPQVERAGRWCVSNTDAEGDVIHVRLFSASDAADHFEWVVDVDEMNPLAEVTPASLRRLADEIEAMEGEYKRL